MKSAEVQLQGCGVAPFHQFLKAAGFVCLWGQKSLIWGGHCLHGDFSGASDQKPQPATAQKLDKVVADIQTVISD